MKPSQRNTMTYSDDLQKAIDVLKKGGIIVYPTDTIWGIGCDACNANAVAKVYDIKKRIDSKALIVLTHSATTVERYVRDMPEIAFSLIELSSKPLTIIYNQAMNLAPNLLADDGSVGIRVTDEEFSKQLCLRFGRPIVSTSANISGEPSPQCFAQINKAILDAADYVVNFRQQETSNPAPSSIIKLGSGCEIKIIRE